MKRIICIFATLLFAICMVAQPNRQNGNGGNGGKVEFSPEEFQKHMEFFIAFRAGLTPEESCKFFPLLKEMLDAQRNIDFKKRKLQKFGKEVSEEEAKKIIQETIELDLQNEKIAETYYTKKFPKVLSWSKILKVRNAIELFKFEALRKFAPNHYGHNNHGPKKQ